MSTSTKTSARLGIVAALCLGVAGCAVGPNFRPPPPPRYDRYAGPGEADAPSGALGGAVDPRWWSRFRSPALDALVAEGLKHSPSLAAAEAALDASRDQARAGAGVFLPSLDGGFSAIRERSTPLKLGQTGQTSTFSLYTATGSVSYAVDLFGGLRRSAEALNAAADRARYTVGSAYLALTGNIVDAAIARAGYAAEVEALTDIVQGDADQHDVLKAEDAAGHGALGAVLLAEQQLSSDRQSLAAAQQREATSAHLLTDLIGREQGEGAPPGPTLATLRAPDSAPVSLPSDLVRQRPDILQAEASLHQASATVGVATAALLPSISLTGDYGAAQTALSSLGGPAGRFWSIGPTINIPIFEGGSLWFQRKAALAGLAQAEASYRLTVLAALEQVSDSLAALRADTEIDQAARTTYGAASTGQSLADSNLAAGIIAGYDALGFRIAADRARIGLIDAKAQRLQDFVALYLACGGGWDGREPSATEAPR